MVVQFVPKVNGAKFHKGATRPGLLVIEKPGVEGPSRRWTRNHIRWLNKINTGRFSGK